MRSDRRRYAALWMTWVLRIHIQFVLQSSEWRRGMIPTCSILWYDAFVNHHVEDRLTEDSVLLYANLCIDALKCICDPLRDVDWSMDVGRK
jgi:hypothetical protein